MAERIAANAATLLKHAENLIDLSLATLGRDTPTIARVDVAGMLHRLVASAANEGRANVTVALEMAPDVGPVLTDGAKLEPVLDNLLSNALKFTAKGAVTLRAKLVDADDSESDEPAASYCDPRRRFLSLSVTDTGIGIDPAEIAKVLRGFHQASRGSSRRYAGLGIGLRGGTKARARSLGGQIYVKSTALEGSQFDVLVPVLLT